MLVRGTKSELFRSLFKPRLLAVQQRSERRLFAYGYFPSGMFFDLCELPDETVAVEIIAHSVLLITHRRIITFRHLYNGIFV